MKRFPFAAAFLAAAGSAGAASAHEFIFYFKFDSVEFNASPARPTWFYDVAKDTACYARQPSATWVRIAAHADTAGPADYNLALSRRRAERVADLLVREGVPRDRITLDARGESVPAVAMGDDVPEPLNRRATIDVAFGPGPYERCEGPTLPKFPPPPAK